MESTPSSGSDSPTPLTRRTNPALAVRSWSRSRRVRTFGLGALCGALGLSLVVVVSSIFAAAGDGPPVLPEPAPAADVRTTPRPTPTPVPTPTPASPVDTVDATTDVPEEESGTDPVVEPAPAPIESVEPPVVEEGSSTSPGNSGTAPGRNKDPKTP